MIRNLHPRCLGLLALVLVSTAPLGSAWTSLESGLRRDGDETVKVFEAQRAVLQKSSAVIYQGRDELGYGLVVSADGKILVKASEVVGKDRLSVMVDTTHYDAVQVLGTDDHWDVALLKVAAEGLVPVRFASGTALAQGTWLVTNGVTSRTQRRALAGIVSARTREIPPEGGAALGVELKADAENAVVLKVTEKSGAAEAGLQPGDVIVSIQGHKIRSKKDIADVVHGLKVGEAVPLTYKRKGEEATVDVKISERAALFKGPASRNDQMSGDVSSRRAAFPRVFQHDILGAANSVGGPMLNLDGMCVGMNIARANRAESFAIPSEDVQEILRRLDPK